MQALIFDIQRGSFVDGEGVRTTVFFKGCNLKCAWCHNPEGMSREKQLLYYRSRCNSCGKCKEICSKNEKECDLCGKCAILCPFDAKEICGKEYGYEELLEIIERDCDLYNQTHGGVTFSGGECMLQIDFLEKILRACKEKGINTAVDTAGNVPKEYFLRILPFVDTFLYDVKCVNEALHKRFTGVSNRLILENLEFICSQNVGVVVRVPVVDGFNANDGEMEAIFKLLKKNGVHRVELLPYHSLGEHKYEGCGLTPVSFTAPEKSQMEKYNKMLGDIL